VHCAITTDPIDISGLISLVRSDSDGAVVTFVGVVRNQHENRQVVSLRYEAYEQMAEAKLHSICDAVKSQVAVGDIAVVHRIGDLEIGDASVVIAVAAPHRDAAYQASREIIERIKRELPVWKKERFADGEEEWQEGRPVEGI
jgi:molybdopterin synthase catalytic subunit